MTVYSPEFQRLRWSWEVLRRGDLPTLAAKLRWLWWRHVRRYDTEVCHECGRPVSRGIASWWHAPDVLWLSVPLAAMRGVLCPACFRDAAPGRLIYFAAREEDSNQRYRRDSA